jgi:small subunit ribosomal protein S5
MLHKKNIFQEKIIQIKRVTKVSKGGKKMSFRALVIIGDKIQKVGLGIGSADDVDFAIEKAIKHGKKNLITVPITLSMSIPHNIHMNYGACKVLLFPATIGTGVIAGSSIRTILELAGIKNIFTKQIGAKNILNNAKATILALTKLKQEINLKSSFSYLKNKYYNQIF